LLKVLGLIPLNIAISSEEAYLKGAGTTPFSISASLSAADITLASLVVDGVVEPLLDGNHVCEQDFFLFIY